MRAKRVQRHPMIDADLSQQLRVYCATKRVTETAVFNGALRDYFADAKDTALIMRRLDRNDRAIAVARQSVEILSETFVAFMLSHFTNTPEMPAEQRRLGATAARRRLDEVLDAASRRFADGERLLDLLPKDRLADDAEMAAASHPVVGDGSSRS